MGSYQIHISCYSKERTRKMESQATVGESGQLHTSQELSNIRETAKTEHQKTSITTLTYFGFYSVPFHAAPWLQPPVPCSSWIPLSVLCACTAQSAWSKHSHSLLCLSSCPPAPSESRFLSNHLISQAHSPSYSSQGLSKPLPFCETSALFLNFLRSWPCFLRKWKQLQEFLISSPPKSSPKCICVLILPHNAHSSCAFSLVKDTAPATVPLIIHLRNHS